MPRQSGKCERAWIGEMRVASARCLPARRLCVDRLSRPARRRSHRRWVRRSSGLHWELRTNRESRTTPRARMRRFAAASRPVWARVRRLATHPGQWRRRVLVASRDDARLRLRPVRADRNALAARSASCAGRGPVVPGRTPTRNQTFHVGWSSARRGCWPRRGFVRDGFVPLGFAWRFVERSPFVCGVRRLARCRRLCPHQGVRWAAVLYWARQEARLAAYFALRIAVVCSSRSPFLWTAVSLADVPPLLVWPARAYLLLACRACIGWEGFHSPSANAIPIYTWRAKLGRIP